jgi:hypothetical protein
MKCPHCNEELSIPSNVECNMESYGMSVLIAAPCCQQPIKLLPRFSYRVVPYETDREDDDWGNPFAKQEHIHG